MRPSGHDKIGRDNYPSPNDVCSHRNPLFSHGLTIDSSATYTVFSFPGSSKSLQRLLTAFAGFCQHLDHDSTLSGNPHASTVTSTPGSVIPPSPFVPRILLSKMRGVLQD